MAIKDNVKKGLLAATVVVGSVGGSYAAVQTNQPAAPATTINAEQAHAAYFGTKVVGVQGVGMVHGQAPHMHLEWVNIPNSKGFIVYVDDKKQNAEPIRKTDEKVKHTIEKGVEAGKSYKVTVAYVNQEGKEVGMSDPITVTVPVK